MNEERQLYRKRLQEALNPATSPPDDSGGYLIKGDVSGIQEFIFSVPSKGAARLLKARSFFIQILVKICIQKIQDELNETELISDSGGSFYLKSKNDPDGKLAAWRKEINRAISSLGVYMSLSGEEITSWGEANSKLQEKGEKQKFQLFNGLSTNEFAGWFEPEHVYDSEADVRKWKDFAKELAFAKSYTLQKTDSETLLISEKTISLLGYEYRIYREFAEGAYVFNDENPQHFIMKAMPVWSEKNVYLNAFKEGDEKVINWERNVWERGGEETEDEAVLDRLQIGGLIDLDHLELQARQRTGTGKLGVLKLDVDNLGGLFRESFTSMSQYRKASDAFAFFFGKELFDLWKREAFSVKGQTYLFSDNLLVIFSGGDDCFIVGGWDAVFEFSRHLHERFEQFIEGTGITFSAGLLIVDAGYPMIRLGHDAELVLEKAKSGSKNSICLFGEVFQWGELTTIKELVETLTDLVTKEQNPESKSLLQKIRMSAKGYRALMDKLEDRKQVNFQKVWNLTWFILRGVKKENHRKIDEQIVSKYHNAVLDALMNDNYSSALVYPAAARWTELLTRNN